MGMSIGLAEPVDNGVAGANGRRHVLVHFVS